MKNQALLLLVALLLVALLPAPASAASLQKDIEANLICQCGCTMVVIDCQCDLAEQMRADIAKKIESGMDRQSILASYVDVYGKAVLAAPPKEGFDLTAWITPFLAIVAGGVLLYVLLRRWVERSRGSFSAEKAADPVSIEDEARYEGKIKDALKKYF